MHSYRVTRKLEPAVAAYIAGLIDGEGTVTLTRNHAGENRRLVVSVANTELQLLEFLSDQIGAGKITKKRTVSDRHTPSYCYAISSQQALMLLQQVSPYMISYKRRRAQLALDSYESLTPRNGKYTLDCRNRRSAFEAAFLSVTSKTPEKVAAKDEAIPQSLQRQ
jgi:hypothetical protein